MNLWNNEKKRLHHKAKEKIIFHEGQIWWCSIGKNLGDEEDGKNILFERPVLIIKKFNSKIAWVLPMSSKMKKGEYYHSIMHNKKVSTLLLSQLRIVSVKRLRRIMDKISAQELRTIREKIKNLI